MKKAFVVALGLFPVTGFAAGKKKPVFVEPMECVGSIAEKDRPEGMADSYYYINMEFVSFKTKKKNGKFANSLEISNSYSSDGRNFRGSEVWYTGPLYANYSKNLAVGHDVTRDSLSGRNDNLELEVKTVTEEDDGTKYVELKGTYSIEGSVVGSYSYDLDCWGYFEKTPSKVVDLTSAKKKKK